MAILPELKLNAYGSEMCIRDRLMAKKKKKPSKRGKKAYKISLHCSPMIVTQEKKIKKLAKWIKAIAEFIKALIQLSNVMKPLIEWCKSFFELL